MLYNSNIEKVSRISTQIDSYITSLGKARIAVYQFPALSERRDFSLFLNALMANLRRAELRPVYSWSYDEVSRAYTLILLVSGYWRKDMNDVTEAMNRLWKLYSPGYMKTLADMAVNIETLDQDKAALWNVLQQAAFSPMPGARVNPYHQRQFACCRVC